MNDTFRYTLIPVILGANIQARKWSDRFLRRYRVCSIVMSDTFHPAMLLPFSLRFQRLRKKNGYTDFILSDLIRFSQDHPDKLLVLIGATPHYAALIRENSELLDSYYILSDPELSFLSREGLTAP